MERPRDAGEAETASSSVAQPLGIYCRDCCLKGKSVSNGSMKQARTKDAEGNLLLESEAFSDGSYMIVECSKLRRSNIRTLPSAPQETNTSTLLAQNRTSKTSLS